MAEALDVLIRGSAVELRPFEERLITETYLSWLNDQELMRYSRQRFSRHSRHSAIAYLRSFENSPNRFWSIHRRADDLHVGTITAYLDPVARAADIGILVGHTAARGQGLGREAWGLAMDYLFRVEGVGVVTGGTAALNRAMVRIFRYWQMRLESMRVDEEPDGRSIDVLRFAMLRSEWDEQHPHSIAQVVARWS